MQPNLPSTSKKRIVVVGAGFAGLNTAYRLRNSDYQIVLIDKHNFHQFQPLFYQVAMSGLEPSSIIFPLRKMFQNNKNVHIRVASLEGVNSEQNKISTTVGDINYDHLVLATGATTNFYGMDNIEDNAYTLKSISESIFLRNNILAAFERALVEKDYEKRKEFLTIVIVGGGPTGVELAGALAEMKKFILPKDYQELDPNEVKINLIQMGDEILAGMKDKSSEDALMFLENMGVNVKLGTAVNDYNGVEAELDNGEVIKTRNMIWAAGIKSEKIDGLRDFTGRADRLIVNEFNRVRGHDSIYAIGDLALMETDDYKNGHPQVAQVAIQQAKNLVVNFKAALKGKEAVKFEYVDKGTMATIGRNKAVADLPSYRFSGFFAWLLWLGVHLFTLLGTKNKLFVFINWIWNYMTYDQSLRLIIQPYTREEKTITEGVGEEK